MDVEEDRTIAFAKRAAVEPAQRAANRLERAGGHVAGDDRIRHAREPAVPEVHVGAAHLGARGAQQRGAGRQIGTRELAHLDGPPGGRHHGGEDAIAHGVRYP